MVSGLYFNNIITKSLQPINSEDRFFEGYLTVQMKDKQGEITIVDELYKVLPVWMDRGAPISDTHSNRIIGKGINYAKTIYKDEDGIEYPAIKITGKIHKNYELDNDIWDKIKSGEYRGLSFGGATRSDRTPIVMKDGSIAYALKDLEHYEVAVCKDPAVPLALITDYNRIAKAMAGYTEDRGDKMLIKCSKFGCYVEKEHKQNFDAKTGQLKLHDPTQGDGTQAMVTSPKKGNKVVSTGGSKQLENIKRLQSGVNKLKRENKKSKSYVTKPISDGHGGSGDFKHCESGNQDKNNASAFCGAIQRDTEGKKKALDRLIDVNKVELKARGIRYDKVSKDIMKQIKCPNCKGKGEKLYFNPDSGDYQNVGCDRCQTGGYIDATEGKKKAKSVSNITIMKAPKKEGIGNITSMKAPKEDKKLQNEILDHITQSYLQTKANKIMANFTILELGTSLLKKTL